MTDNINHPQHYEKPKTTAPWMTKKETAEYLRRTTRTLDRWIRLKYFPAGSYKLGRPYWKVKDVDKWMTTRPDLQI